MRLVIVRFKNIGFPNTYYQIDQKFLPWKANGF